LDLSSARRVFLVGLVGSMCATAALAIGILLFSEFDETSARILGTTGALAFFSLVGLPAGVLLDQGRARPLGWASFGVAASGLVLLLVLLWADWDDVPETLWKLALTATSFAVAGAQAAATTSRLRETDPPAAQALYALGLVAGLTLASMVTLATWVEVDSAGYYRALAAIAVVVVLFTLLQPVLRKMAAPRAPKTGGHGLRMTLADGREIMRFVDAGDFADAVARTVREVERGGSRVTKIERLEGGQGPS
jgi:hypothetical protein